MAEENRTSIFRKKSEDYIDSPEKLDQYLRVTSPGVWALLGTVMVILIGAIIWGTFGRLETHATVAIVVENGESLCLVPEDALDNVIDNPIATLDGEELTLAPDTLKATVISEETNVYVMLAGGFSVGDVVYEIPVEADLADGVYSGTVLTETITPMSLLMN